MKPVTPRNLSPETCGPEMHSLIKELYPICRSITGDGLRRSLQILGHHIPLKVHEVSSGTRVFDWTVPNEWNIRDAYVRNPQGKKVIDFQRSNLHVVQYSRAIHKRIGLGELKQHLYSIPEKPEWIPYRTSYYQENWGFCISHNALQSFEDGVYEVLIDASLKPGSLSYGEYHLPGKTRDEVLISCHCCHPSLCNDNLSGMALTTFLAKHLSSRSLKYSYRFLFIPGTIGSIAWLALNEDQVEKIRHGLVVACVGDRGRPVYKKTRHGDAEIDHAAIHVLKHSNQGYEITDFTPYGYDERQYCSPGFNLPVGSLTRTPHGRYPEYHTSADDLELVSANSLADSLALYLKVVDVLEKNRVYRNTCPKCEPQLGRRGLYGALGGRTDTAECEMALLWVLNLSDGTNTLLEIAERAGLEFQLTYEAACALKQHELLEEVRGHGLAPRGGA